MNTAQKVASKRSAKQDEEATMEEVPGSIVLYTEEEISSFNRDVKRFRLDTTLLNNQLLTEQTDLAIYSINETTLTKRSGQCYFSCYNN